MREVTHGMKARGPFDGEQQERALRSHLHYHKKRLRTRSGKTLDDLATELDMKISTLHRYLSGQQPLCSDQFESFARALETTKDELIAACFPAPQASGLPAPEPTLRELLEAEGLPDDEITQLESSIGNEPTTLELRQGMALMAREVMRKRRAEAGQGRRRA